MKKIEKRFFKNVEPTRLAELVFNQEVNKLVNKINESYYYWDKVKYLQMPSDVSAEEIWAIAKFRRKNSPYKIAFGNYNFTWFLTNKIQLFLHLFDLNIGGTLESKSLIPGEERNRYLVNSIMEEAIASSQIEGAVTTRKQAKDMLRKNRPPRDKSEQMIMNNYVTIQKILTIKDEPLTQKRLLEIHGLIANNTLADKNEEGCFREANDINVIDVSDGTIVHQPPDAMEIIELIDHLCVFFNSDDNDLFIHPIIKGCIIHFIIGYIHPFSDGNGRTARALFYWYLLRKGYWLTEYLSISRLILKSKTSYAKAFLYTETDENDLTYFINYKLKTMQLAYESLRMYIQGKLQEKKTVSEFQRIKDINERQGLIMKWFYEEAGLMLTVKEIETRFAISNQTARSDLQALVKEGYLELINVNLKTQAFGRAKNFETILKERLRGSQSTLFN